MKILETLGQYVSPSVEILDLFSEGVLCTSGTHESLKEDDSWIDLLD